MIHTTHHAIADGWSTAIVKGSLLAAYDGQPLSEGMPFKNHVRFVIEQDSAECESFWRKSFALHDTVQSLPFIQSPDLSQPRHGTIQLSFDIDIDYLNQLQKELNITTSTIMRAAWAIMLRKYTRQDQVIFGSVVSGRDSGEDEIER